EVGAVYLWDPKSPLKQYLNHRPPIPKVSYFNAWYAASLPLNDYGWYIIRNYPKEFLKHFIYPNFKRYLYPYSETLANYDAFYTSLTPEVKEWYRLDFDHLSCRFPDLQKRIISVYPAITLILNVLNFVIILFFSLKSRVVWKEIPSHVRGLFLMWCLF